MSSPIALPAAPPLPNAAVTAAASPVVVILDGAAQALATLTAAAQVSGTVAQTETPGELVLLTALGTLALKTTLALPEGTRLVLQAIADRPGAAIVVAINDVPTAPRAAAPAPASATPPPPLPAALPPAVLALGTTVTATIVGGAVTTLPDSRLGTVPELAAAAMPATSAAAGEPSGTALAAAGRTASSLPDDRAPAAAPLARGAALAAPADRTAPALRTGQAATTTPAGAAIPAAAARSDGLRLAAPGSTVALRILAVQPAATPGSLATPALSGIVRPSPQSLAGMLIDTPAGLLRLYPDTAPNSGQRIDPPLPPGTPVALRLLAGTPPAALLTVLADAAPTLPAAEPAETKKELGDKQAAETGTRAPTGDGAEAAPLARPTYRVLLNAPALTSAAPTTPGLRQAAETPAAPAMIVGTVVTSHAAPGVAATLIATPLGTLAVSEPLALPPDTLLLLAPQPDDASAPAASTADPPTRFDKGWSALEATLTTLGHAAPELAAHLRADLSTQSGERLAASLMVLIAALRNNTPRLWPGDAVERALGAAGHDDLKLKLGEEFTEISRLADNPATNPWQVFLLPLIEGAAVRPVRLYLKRRGGRGQRCAEDDHARFILEFELTRLGVLQLDGFVRPKRFDLVLRSHAALAPPLRSAVERIFYDRVAAAGIAGSIDFATAVRFDVAPLDKLRVKVGLAV
ncbi:MAG TPA: hypothetical protein VHT04_07445 [Stellaceae bacterium]|nr:hypothetical protein [Stellaceae bacterium]